MLKPILILSVLVLAFFPLSCATSPPIARKEDPVQTVNPDTKLKEIEASNQLKAMNEKILMASLLNRKGYGRDYKIGPEDLLEITVFEDEKLNKTVRVSSQGNISLPLLGVLKVKSLTSTELEREIQDLLTEKYFQDPHVNIFIKEYRSQRISILGAVEKPGIFEVSGDKTVLDMLAMAGGLKGSVNETAGQLLFLIRPGEGEEGTPGDKSSREKSLKTVVIDLEDLIGKGDMSLNFPLSHGDVINVPMAGKIFVGGEVKKPGGFPMGKKMTVSQAVAMAEGLKLEAKGTETKIFRYSGISGKEVLTVNVDEVHKGSAEDIYLKENDIVMVPKSGMKSFFLEFRDTVKGLLGVGFSLGTL